jgi:hypothetical protein
MCPKLASGVSRRGTFPFDHDATNARRQVHDIVTFWVLWIFIVQGQSRLDTTFELEVTAYAHATNGAKFFKQWVVHTRRLS